MRAVRGLLWAQWRSSWVYAGFGVVTLGLYFIWLSNIDDYIRSPLFSETVGLLLAWVVALLALTFTFVQEGIKGVRLRYPARLFVLPISTADLVTALMLHKIVIAALLGLVLSVTERLVLEIDQAIWLPPLLLMVLVAWAEANVALFTARGARGVLYWGLPLAIISIVLARLALLFLGWNDARIGSLLGFIQPTPGTIGEFMGALCVTSALLLGAWNVAWIGAAQARRGTVLRAGVREVTAPVVHGLTVDHAALRRLMTLVWFEWRQSAGYLPRISLLLFLGVVIAILAYAFRLAESTFCNVAVLGALVSSVLVSFVVGHFMYRSTEWHTTTMLAGPASTVELARAKLAAGSLAVLVTVLLTAALAGLTVIMEGLTSFDRPFIVLLFEHPMIIPVCAATLAITLFLGRVVLLLACALYLPFLLLGMANENFLQAAYLVMTCAAVAITHTMAIRRRFCSIPSVLVLTVVILLAGTALTWYFDGITQWYADGSGHAVTINVRDTVPRGATPHYAIDWGAAYPVLQLLGLLWLIRPWLPLVLEWQRHK